MRIHPGIFFRFLPARAYSKELIESGYIGEPYSASMSFYRSSLNDPRGVPYKEHIHAVVRTPNGNDYGKDLLRQHYEALPH